LLLTTDWGANLELELELAENKSEKKVLVKEFGKWNKQCWNETNLPWTWTWTWIWLEALKFKPAQSWNAMPISNTTTSRSEEWTTFRTRLYLILEIQSTRFYTFYKLLIIFYFYNLTINLMNGDSFITKIII